MTLNDYIVVSLVSESQQACVAFALCDMFQSMNDVQPKRQAAAKS